MLQAGREADLALEALRPERGRELRVQDLEGDRPVVPHVLGEIDGSHPAAPELPLERVAPAQSALELRAEVGQLGLYEGVGSAAPLSSIPPREEGC